MSGFLAMGGYGAYVWASYAVALALLIGLAVASRRALRRAEAELAASEHGGRRKRTGERS